MCFILKGPPIFLLVFQYVEVDKEGRTHRKKTLKPNMVNMIAR